MADRMTKSERTRRRILDAAAEVLSERGYADARLSDIAERAGLQAGSLYYHFGSREELVGEILRLGIEEAWDHVAAAVGRLPPSATPLDRLAAAIRAHTMAVVGLSAYSSAQARILGQLPGDLAAAHRKDQRAYGAYWHDLFVATREAGQIAGDVDLLTARMLTFGAMNWTSEWFRARDRAAIARLGDQAVRLFIHGIGPSAPASETTRQAAARTASGKRRGGRTLAEISNPDSKAR